MGARGDAHAREGIGLREPERPDRTEQVGVGALGAPRAGRCPQRAVSPLSPLARRAPAQTPGSETSRAGTMTPQSGLARGAARPASRDHPGGGATKPPTRTRGLEAPALPAGTLRSHAARRPGAGSSDPRKEARGVRAPFQGVIALVLGEPLLL